LQSVAPQNRHIPILTKAFLSVHWDQTKPLLLGFSGGGDSKALLYALLECGVKPHIAHVDHGWREESQEEAEQMAKEAALLRCPFHSARLEPIERSEDEARRFRYTFFAKLFPSYSALLLAHHAEDLAETVLKRVLEGAHLSRLGGMREVSHQYGMTIWRPFLRVKKGELIQFLEEKGVSFLSDSSNFDPVFLRARMRGQMFPFLNEHFGKEVSSNLALLSERAYELEEYLDAKTKTSPIQKGPWGLLSDLNGLQSLEIRHIIQKMAHLSHLSLNRNHLQTLEKWIQKGEKSKILSLKTKKILVDRGRIWFFLKLQKT
jgi:tRNA(Ile)-lysidine synthase